MRIEHQDAFIKKHDVKLGFMSFFVQAVVHALKAFPEVNAAIDGDDILYFQDAILGIAVSTDRGLVVPVLRKAQDMGYAEIETAIKNYATKQGKVR